MTQILVKHYECKQQLYNKKGVLQNHATQAHTTVKT